MRRFSAAQEYNYAQYQPGQAFLNHKIKPKDSAEGKQCKIQFYKKNMRLKSCFSCFCFLKTAKRLFVGRLAADWLAL